MFCVNISILLQSNQKLSVISFLMFMLFISILLQSNQKLNYQKSNHNPVVFQFYCSPIRSVQNFYAVTFIKYYFNSTVVQLEAARPAKRWKSTCISILLQSNQKTSTSQRSPSTLRISILLQSNQKRNFSYAFFTEYGFQFYCSPIRRYGRPSN